MIWAISDQTGPSSASNIKAKLSVNENRKEYNRRQMAPRDGTGGSNNYSPSPPQIPNIQGKSKIPPHYTSTQNKLPGLQARRQRNIQQSDISNSNEDRESQPPAHALYSALPHTECFIVQMS